MSEPQPRAMILAAGLGTRLRPLTERVPKPLLPVAGRPLLEMAVVRLRAAGVRRIAVNTHHLPELVRGFVAGLPDGGDVSLFHEPVILGTGGALIGARDFLSAGEYFLLHNGDVLTDLDLAALRRAHEADRPLATMVLTDGAENRVRFSADGRVLDILGKVGAGKEPGSRLVTYTGLAAISPRIFEFLPESGPASLPAALIAAIRAEPGCVQGLAPRGLHWNDIGTLERYLAAHRDVLVGRALELPGGKIPPGAVYNPSGVEVPADAELAGFVSVGAGSRIEPGARLSDCVLLDGAVARAGRNYHRAVLGRDFCVAQETLAAARSALMRERPDAEIVPLVEQGSDRQFFRVFEGGASQVLMISPPGDADFARYLAIGGFLAERDLGAPGILALDEAGGAALLEDLGDGTLYILARGEEDGAVLEGLYAAAVDLLAELGARATADIEACPAAAARALDGEQLRWESGYFRENFLERLLGFPEERTAALQEEFARVARAAAAQPQVFIHRDYQSQNILIVGGRARIVDFQGARRGPVGYDLASLLKDAYVEVPPELRARLTERYRLRLAELGGPKLSVDEMRRCLVVAGLQRSMQALGAFCFLSLVKGKEGFRRFVEPGLGRLEEGLAELAGLGARPAPLPKLGEVVAEARRRLEGLEPGA